MSTLILTYINIVMSKHKTQMDKLNEVLGLAKEVNESTSLVMASPIEIEPIDFKEDAGMLTDFNDARETLKRLVKQGEKALTDIVEFSDESDIPRDFGIVPILIKTISDVTKDMISLHKTLAEINKTRVPENKNITKTTTNNNMFVGSTKDMLAMLKDDTGN